MVSLAALLIAAPLMQESIPVLSGRKFDYFLMPPKVVCEGRAKSLEWSLDGRYLVVNRTEYADGNRLEAAVLDAISHSKPPVSAAGFGTQRSSVAVWDNEKQKLAEVWAGSPGIEKCQEVIVTDKCLYLLSSGAKNSYKLYVCEFGSFRTKVLREDRPKDEMMVLAKDADSNQIVYGDLKARSYYLATGNKIKSIPTLDTLPKRLRAQIVLISDQRERKPMSIDWNYDPVEVKYVYGVSRPVDISFEYSEDYQGGKAKGVAGVLSAGESTLVARGLIGPPAVAPDSTAVAYPLDGIVVIRNLVAVPKGWTK